MKLKCLSLATDTVRGCDHLKRSASLDDGRETEKLSYKKNMKIEFNPKNRVMMSKGNCSEGPIYQSHAIV